MAFTFDIGPSGESSDDFNPIDDLVAAAGGAPLPGVFGVAQAVVEVWTQERSGPRWLKFIRSSLLTAGIVRRHQKSKTGETQVHPTEAYIVANGLKPIPALENMDGMVWDQWLTAGIQHEDIKLDAGLVRKFANGAQFIFYDHTSVEQKSQYFYGRLMAAPRLHAAVVKAVVENIWSKAEHGIELVALSSIHGTVLDFAPMDRAGDYIDHPQHSGNVALLQHLTDRCRKFNSAKYARGVLFYGEPGTGKTSLARALAVTVGNGRTVRISPEAMASCSYASRLIPLIELLQPTVLLLDDMDRSDTSSSLLAQLEGRRVPIVIGTVNAVRKIDPALLRPGRFDEVVKVEVPDGPWRRAIVDHYSEKFGIQIDDKYVAQMAGLAPAEILELVKIAGIIGLDVLEYEIERVRMQRRWYEEDAVDEFLNRRSHKSDVPS